MRTDWSFITLATITLGFLGGPVTGQDVVFNRDIRPLLSDRCFHCHGPDEADRQAGLRLDRADGPEGAHQSAIQPGQVESSELYARITSEDPEQVMPPPDSHKKPLTDKEKQLIRRWIEQGAAYQGFWAFETPVMPNLPTDGKANPIDSLVLAALQERGDSLAAEADRRTLIRRLSLDLTGLPPTRDETNAFLNDASEDAYEKLVDRLLASPRYGEHMARYWLDLVRFADTNGIHHDHLRDLSPYRDWVIRAFNDNLPYDDFVRYQLAGDLYPEPTRDQLIASGFHRLHLIIDRGTMLPEESFTRNVLDRVTSVGTAFLGLTVQCAVCHDHKYDPLTMKDFYSLSAFFNNLDAEPETGGRQGTDFLRGLQPPYIELASTEQEVERIKWEAEIDASRARLTKLKEAIQSVGSDKPEKKLLEPLVSAAERELKAAEQSRDDHRMTIPAAMIMKEREEIRPAHVLVRGAYDKPGEQVSRATPAFLPPMKNPHEVPTRMDLAEWFVDRSHPLTARVAVNRFWQQLFGVGIVKTSEDFGAQGEWPSHPELLDYLAVRFVESGWNVRELLREIVMSKTYRQSSFASPQDYQRDPQNRWLARGSRFRMDSEMIRDSILASSGLLNLKMYGKSVKPPQPPGLWEAVSMPSSYPRKFEPDTGGDIYRRSVYTFWKRGMPPPQMTIFNAPSREECIARRERTNTPLQALLLLNESEYLKAARHLALTMFEQPLEGKSDRIEWLFETITAYEPSQADRKVLEELLSDLEALYADSPQLAGELCGDLELPQGLSADQLAAWTMLASSIYNLDLVKTRQ
jgi:hypothetical protein